MLGQVRGLGTGSSAALFPACSLQYTVSMDFKSFCKRQEHLFTLTNGWADGRTSFHSGNTYVIELIDSFGQAGNATKSVGYDFACVLLDTGNALLGSNMGKLEMEQPATHISNWDNLNSIFNSDRCGTSCLHSSIKRFCFVLGLQLRETRFWFDRTSEPYICIGFWSESNSNRLVSSPPVPALS